MTARIIDGKGIAAEIRGDLAKDVAGLTAKGLTPGLDVILVGDNPASAVYVRNKERACKEIGVNSTVHRLSTETTREELLSLIAKLNNDPKVHGILVQLPLPSHLDTPVWVRLSLSIPARILARPKSVTLTSTFRVRRMFSGLISR